ncbi:MAG: sensor histidine kinase [Burkholderiaceae bacterium]
MRLSHFINENLEPIAEEWVLFAATHVPAAASMDEYDLRDHVLQILGEIVTNMGLDESVAQQKDKSQGAGQPSEARMAAPRAHALQRARKGFQVTQMVAEFRALRATVMRLWAGSNHEVTASDINDVTRFNEAVDQALAESLLHFVTEVERTNHLFMAVLGHDIRGPLSAIILGTHAELKRRPESTRWAGPVLRSAAQIKALTNDLLEFTRRRLGIPLPLATKALDLELFAREVLEEVAETSRKRQVNLEVVGDVKGSWDPSRLHQVISNLVFNALKYGDPERPITVTINGEDTESVRICIHNFGNPISSEQLPMVFDSLVRGTTSQEAEDQPGGANLGLGLHITREIVAAHGGTIKATSAEDVGTKFDISLPRKAESQATVPQA